MQRRKYVGVSSACKSLEGSASTPFSKLTPAILSFAEAFLCSISPEYQIPSTSPVRVWHAHS